MNQSRFTGMLSCAAMVFFLTSCGGSGGEKASKDSAATMSADTTATTAVVAAPVNTTVTTPTNMVVVTHKVANFAKWLTSYDQHDSARLASGLHNYVVGRGIKDTNMVMVALKADDMAKAKAFTKDPGLKKAMQKGGVTGPPTISFLVNTWQDTAALGPDVIRSRTMFAVKDFAAWQKSFEEGKQERIDNGIADRVVGHDIDDSKKVMLVTAVLDTAKAFAYYKSDALKKRRAAGGVVGEPNRFLFRVVKRY
jgi:hypothetical protein